MKTWGDGGVATPFLISTLDGGEWSDSRHGSFTLGERAPVPLDRRLGGPRSQSGHCGEEKILPPKILIEYTDVKKEDTSKNSLYQNWIPNALMLLTTN
jgi:hypothetical protein